MPDPNSNPVVSGNTAFGVNLYDQLNNEAGNVFYSPFSVSAALAMTAAGAKGETLTQMQKVLHLPPEQGIADSGFQKLFAALNAGDPKTRGFTLSVANAIFAQKGYPWRPEFKNRVTGQYGAGLKEADFISNPEEERKTINTWVEKETRDRIKDLLAKGTITPLTRMVLANAIYFKGDWETEFRKDLTLMQPFIHADGTHLDTPLMHRVGRFAHTELDGFQIAELPYKGGETSMVVLLPDQPNGLAALEKKLTADALRTWLRRLRPTPDVQLYLPKFKLETDYGLNDPLKALGMVDAFGGKADFTGMSAGAEDLAISAVIHKAFVEVNEEGTEAAAATAVVIRATAAPVDPPKPVIFRADHPFLFLIRHRPTDSVLFMGRYSDLR